ncbi:TonB-dependent receptor plug domain-containing protein [Pseudoduganella rivuli]|uniref:TonB-dependent receptor plug domain-containing protein n=1 Tax=Pseudoduganella rivuli TaxID=2666085 RepID=UPI0012B027B0|nr:TonB-dependent receptor [Pseudoduganella rivuli]
MNPVLKTTLAAVLATCGNAAYAANSADAAVQRVEITGSAAQAQRRNETAGRIIVGRDELLQYGDGALSGALQRLPGVTVSGNEVRMRGLGNGYTQILVNGDPAPPGFTIDSLSPELVERIEILRNATADTSAQAVAGSINIVLRRATSARNDVKAGVEVRRGQMAPNATLQVAGKEGGFAYTVAATAARNHFDNLSHAETADAGPAGVSRRQFDERYGSTVDKASMAPRFEWKGDGDTLVWQSLFDAYRTRSGGHADETTLLGGATASPHVQVVFASHTETLRSDATWTHRLDNDGKLEAKGGIALNRRHGDYLFTGADTERTPWLLRSVLSSASDDSASASGKASVPLGTGHGFGAGWDGAWTRRGETRVQHDGTPQGVTLFDLDQDYTADVRRLALYAQDEWEPVPGLQVYGGLRWEGLDTSITGRGMAKTGVRSSVWSPVAQALWKDGERMRWRMALARTYKAPQTAELVPRRYTVNNDNGPTAPHVQGNPLLRPELAWGIDGGVEYYPAGQGGGVIGVSAYARRVTDVTVRRLYRDGKEWVATPVNEGKASVSGLEFDMKLPPATWAGMAWTWRANAARNWSKLDSVPGPDNRLADQTPLSANLGADVRPGGAWSMGANFTYKGGGALRRSAELDGVTGAERVLDWYALWKPAAGRQLRISVADALAQRRYVMQRYRDEDSSSLRQTWTRGARILRVSFETALP